MLGPVCSWTSWGPHLLSGCTLGRGEPGENEDNTRGGRDALRNSQGAPGFCGGPGEVGGWAAAHHGPSHVPAAGASVSRDLACLPQLHHPLGI